MNRRGTPAAAGILGGLMLGGTLGLVFSRTALGFWAVPVFGLLAAGLGALVARGNPDLAGEFDSAATGCLGCWPCGCSTLALGALALVSIVAHFRL